MVAEALRWLRLDVENAGCGLPRSLEKEWLLNCKQFSKFFLQDYIKQ